MLLSVTICVALTLSKILFLYFFFQVTTWFDALLPPTKKKKCFFCMQTSFFCLLFCIYAGEFNSVTSCHLRHGQRCMLMPSVNTHVHKRALLIKSLKIEVNTRSKQGFKEPTVQQFINHVFRLRWPE